MSMALIRDGAKIVKYDYILSFVLEHTTNLKEGSMVWYHFITLQHSATKHQTPTKAENLNHILRPSFSRKWSRLTVNTHSSSSYLLKQGLSAIVVPYHTLLARSLNLPVLRC